MKKEDRQNKILELIETYAIGTQEELTGKLTEAGYHATQATVSRDIRELGLKKVSEKGEGKRYVADRSGGNNTYRQILSGGVVSMEAAGNLIVLKTVSGAAMAVGAALDNMKQEGMAGCIAGDDTIFLAVRSVQQVEPLLRELEHLVLLDRR